MSSELSIFKNLRVTASFESEVGMIATNLSVQRGGDPRDFRGEAVCVRKNQLAYGYYLRRESTGWSEQEEWAAAECEYKWGTDKRLKPYFAIEASDQRFPARLDEAFRMTPLRKGTHLLVATLDGAPEFAKRKYMVHEKNCRVPFEVVNEKDKRFYQIAADAIALMRGCVWEQVLAQNTSGEISGKSGSGKSWIPGETLAAGRYFQDACIGFFHADSPRKSICNALATGLYLINHFRRMNVELDLPWEDAIGVRVAIADSSNELASGLLYTDRDELTVEQSLFNELSDCHKTTLLASGVRVHSNSPTAPSTSNAT